MFSYLVSLPPSHAELLLLPLSWAQQEGAARQEPGWAPWESPINLLLAGDKAFARMFLARFGCALGAARSQEPCCCQMQRFMGFLQHDTPWPRGWGEPKGFGGSRTSQHHCGSCFAPAQACSCWGHMLPIAPHLLLH